MGWNEGGGDVSYLGSLCPNRPRGGMRPGLYDDAIMFGLWAQ